MLNKTAPRKGLLGPHKNWKHTQKKIKTQNSIKIALVLFLFLTAVILLGVGSKAINNIYSSIQLPSTQTQHWDGNSVINLLVKNSFISVVSYDPNQRSIKVLNLPGDLLVNVPRGFGEWQLQSVYSLGEDGSGMDLLKDSVSNTLGIKVDGFIQPEGKFEEKKTAEVIDEIRGNPFNLPNVILNLKTDLSPFNLLKVLIGIKGVRFDKVENYDLSYQYLDRSTLADGTPVYIPDPAKIDSIVQKLADQTIIKEGASIAVFNATGYSGLAQKAARVISNMGGNVIITTNSTNQITMTQIMVSQDGGWEKSQTYKKFKQVFVSSDLDCYGVQICDTIICKVIQKPKKCNISDDKVFESRADINIILGEDFYLGILPKLK